MLVYQVRNPYLEVRILEDESQIPDCASSLQCLKSSAGMCSGSKIEKAGDYPACHPIMRPVRLARGDSLVVGPEEPIIELLSALRKV